MKDELVQILENRFDCCDITQLIHFLIDSGIISEKNLTHYLIKHEYHQRLKDSRDVTFIDIKMDLAAEFDVSYPTVQNIIYKKPYLKP